MNVFYSHLVGQWRYLASITNKIYNDNKKVRENLSRAAVNKTKHIEY